MDSVRAKPQASTLRCRTSLYESAHSYLRNLRLPAETIMGCFDLMQEQTSPSAIVLFTRQLVGDNGFIAFGGFWLVDLLYGKTTRLAQASGRSVHAKRMRPSNHESRTSSTTNATMQARASYVQGTLRHRFARVSLATQTFGL
jgi:hypothetical protein